MSNSEKKDREPILKKLLKLKPKEMAAIIGETIVLANCAMLLIVGMYSYITLTKIPGIISSIFYIAPVAIIPFFLWALATNLDYYAFIRRKKYYLILCIVNALLAFLLPLFDLYKTFFSYLFVKIPTNPLLTSAMIIFLVYVVTLAGIVLTAALLYKISQSLMSELVMKEIMAFKLMHVIDNRKNAKNRYDLAFYRDQYSGRKIKIKENDRYMQTNLLGASGTGKTSAIFLNGIFSDLKQKYENQKLRLNEWEKLIKEEKITLVGPIKEFEESAIQPVGTTLKEFEKNRKLISKINDTYPDCGITVMAPNNDVIVNILKMARAHNIKVNVIDPLNHYYDFPNAVEVSLNPFYLPLDLDETTKVETIASTANIFAEVLIATNTISGNADPYFKDLSYSVAANVSSVVMLAKNIVGEQATIKDIQECLANFEEIQKYVNTIEDYYGSIISTSSKTNINNIPNIDETTPVIPKAVIKDNPYANQIKFVKNELLGPGAKDMFSQSRGLRNLVDKITQNPKIKNKLNGTEENRIDFDKCLADNQITVISTAISLGQEISTSFGLFCLLMHRTATFRRPKERSPHFLWIDECAQYIHPVFNDIIALYRQYKVAATITEQTLSQFEKYQTTGYMKTVALSAATQVVFGRLSPDEMKLFSDLAGTARTEMDQKTISQNAVLSEDPSYTTSTRTTPTLDNYMESSEMRYRDFLELTLFTVNSGLTLRPKHVKLFFVKEDEFKERKPLIEHEWEELVPEAFTSGVVIRNTEEGKGLGEEERLIFDYTQTNAVEEDSKEISDEEIDEFLDSLN